MHSSKATIFAKKNTNPWVTYFSSRVFLYIARRTGIRLFLVCMSQNVRIIQDLERNVCFQHRQLVFHLSPKHTAKLNEFVELTRRMTKEKCRSQQKCDALWEQSVARIHCPHSTNKWVINLSSRPLSAIEEGVTAKGLSLLQRPENSLSWNHRCSGRRSQEIWFLHGTGGKNNDRRPHSKIQTNTLKPPSSRTQVLKELQERWDYCHCPGR